MSANSWLVRRKLLGPLPGHGAKVLHPLVDPLHHLFQAAGEGAVIVDVSDDLLPHLELPIGEREEVQLIGEEVPEIVGLAGRGLVVLLAPVVLLLPTARVEPFQEDLLPVDLLLFLRLRLLQLLLDVRFGHLQERVLRHLLLQMLLQVEQGHVEQLHRLIQARVDLHLLLHLLALKELRVESAAHAIAPSGRSNRCLIRCVKVGPR